MSTIRIEVSGQSFEAPLPAAPVSCSDRQVWVSPVSAPAARGS